MSQETTGRIFDIQRFCLHDGPGIRTTVFVKGCPLRCVWCHNPESISSEKEVSYQPTLCIHCGACAEVCPADAHGVVEGRHRYDRSRCRVCLRCVEYCCPGALEVVGRDVSVREVIEEVLKDRLFYEESGGGMTISGGEPMAQFSFTSGLLERARSEGIHTCLETAGWGRQEDFVKVVPLVDLFLWDIKDTDVKRHSSYIGGSLDLVLDNLRQVDAAGGRTLLRCLMIPEYNMNTSHLDNVIRIYRSLKHSVGVELPAYNPFKDAKYECLGREAPTDPVFKAPTPDELNEANAYLRDRL